MIGEQEFGEGLQGNPNSTQEGATSLRIFQNPQFGDVRTLGTPENPLFCLSDVCKALDLHSNVVRQRLTEGVCSTYPLSTAGGTQQVNFINEDGLYDVILDSKKPEAKAFRKWITSEVMPSIRKEGGYMVARPEETDDEILSRAILIAQKTVERVEKRNRELEQANRMLDGRNEALEQENKYLAPKADYTDKVLQSDSTYTFTQMAKELGLGGAPSLIDRLTNKGIIYRQSKTIMLHSKYCGKGFTATRTAYYTKPDGTMGTNTILVWTEKGRAWLHYNKEKLINSK